MIAVYVRFEIIFFFGSKNLFLFFLSVCFSLLAAVQKGFQVNLFSLQELTTFVLQVHIVTLQWNILFT